MPELPEVQAHAERLTEAFRGDALARFQPITFTALKTAVAVATGQLNAQEAFMAGRIRLTGDQQKLLDSQEVFRALDSIFTTVRARTEYR